MSKTLTTPEILAMPRRRLIASAAAMLIAPTLWRPVRAQAARALTPAQTEGPFYPTAYPADSDFDLLVQSDRRYSQGTPVWLDGVVTDIDGKPVRGAVVEIWQCDQQGHYPAGALCSLPVRWRSSAQRGGDPVGEAGTV